MNLYQDVFFKGLDMVRGRRTIERLHFLRRSQYWDPEKMREWQLERHWRDVKALQLELGAGPLDRLEAARQVFDSRLEGVAP